MASETLLQRWLAGLRTERQTPRGSGGRAGTALIPGEVFACDTTSGTSELARVLSTVPDDLGISHVRFELFYRYRFRTVAAGERTLSLPAFRRRFPRRIELTSSDDTDAEA